MANSKIETSFQNLVNVIKEKTFSATDGSTLQAAVANIQIDITDLGISKIGISQIGMSNGVASLDANARIPDIELPIDLIHTSQIGMANGVASLDANAKIPDIELPIDLIHTSQIGMAGGVASLGLDGKVPDSQLPEISSGGGIVRAFSTFAFNKGGFYGSNVWTDGTDIYQSNGSSQWVLNQSDLTWSDKTWNGYTSIIGAGVWTDGTNIYYSNNANQYVLDKSTSTWSAKTWTGLTSFQGGYIWTDGTDIYYSNGTQQWVLDKSTSTWSAKTWTGLTNYTGNNVWTDGENIYYSQNNTQYVLDKSTSTWSTKAWSGVTGITGSKIWKDGTKIHFSNTSTQAVLDRTLNTWNDENWFGDITSIDGSNIWSIGTEIFYTNGSTSGHLVDYDMAQMLEQNNGIATLGSNGRLKETQTYYVSAGKKSGTTLGSNATAEGSSNTASGQNSHAEGVGTQASGENSHAEGWDTKATHKASHAGGYGTQTGAQYQSVIGKYNVGKATTVFEIGNGTNTGNRSNAVEVDWSGNATFAGDVIATVDNVTIPLSEAQLQTLSSAITIGGTSYTTVEDSIEALNDTKVSKTGDTIDGDLTIKGSIEIWTAGSVYYAVDDAEHHDVRFHSFSKGSSGEDNVGAYIGTYDTELGFYDYDFNRFDSPSHSSPGRYIKIAIYDYRGQVRGDEIYSFIIDSENLPTATQSDPISVPIPADIYAVEVMPIDINLSTTINTSGITTTGDIADGDGNVLSNKLNSSDISAWAKASTKPSYGISEITGITAQTTDPGAGSALTTGNIIFVYDA